MITAAIICIGFGCLYGVTRDFVEAWPRISRLLKGDFRDER